MIIQFSNDSNPNTSWVEATIQCHINGQPAPMPAGTTVVCTLRAAGLARARKKDDKVAYTLSKRADQTATYFQYPIEKVDGFLRDYTKVRKYHRVLSTDRILCQHLSWKKGESAETFSAGMLATGRSTVRVIRNHSAMAHSANRHCHQRRLRYRTCCLRACVRPPPLAPTVSHIPAHARAGARARAPLGHLAPSRASALRSADAVPLRRRE